MTSALLPLGSLAPTPHIVLSIEAPVVCHLDYSVWYDFYSSPQRSFRFCKAYVLRVNFLVTSPFPQVALITGLDLVLGEAYTVEWNLTMEDVEKIDCYPDEDGASEAKCLARGCAWEVKMLMVLS